MTFTKALTFGLTSRRRMQYPHLAEAVIINGSFSMANDLNEGRQP